jgi:hypothetical protein
LGKASYQATFALAGDFSMWLTRLRPEHITDLFKPGAKETIEPRSYDLFPMRAAALPSSCTGVFWRQPQPACKCRMCWPIVTRNAVLCGHKADRLVRPIR